MNLRSLSYRDSGYTDIVIINMATQDEIRDDLDDELFNSDIAKTVILTNLTAPTYNEWGELTNSVETTSSIPIVPYNLISDRRELDPSGDQDVGDYEAAIRYDVVVNLKDKILMEGDNYTIIDINPNYLPDNVVTIITLFKDV